MPKLKTNKAVKKRFKVTKNKKVFAPASFRRHLLTDRTQKKKRQLRKMKRVDPTERKRIIRMLPYV